MSKYRGCMQELQNTVRENQEVGTSYTLHRYQANIPFSYNDLQLKPPSFRANVLPLREARRVFELDPLNVL